ncbi:MAG TPA: glutaminase A [Thermoleophilaceae bacterium]|nr:glutaminase A [Thermoleophilaceae bacterium]
MQRTLVNDLLAQVHDRWMDDRSGEVLHGIPALENVDPDTFGICLATADGHVYEEGDTDLPFCIQSISKAFTYGMALEDNGTKQVDAKIDVEPSGDLFNEISLHPVTHRPRNPMINAGAIAAASLVRGASVHDQIERVQSNFSDYAGRRLEIDDDIYASMQESGHRNRAISHMLREFGILECSPDDALEVYLRACSTMVTCCDLAMMGATLANLGINPQTGKTVLPQLHMERVLSVMSTCGMYDAAGEWVASVGMAAKSGVGGGIVAVLPGQLALAVFSPRLDEHGNSVRGVQACRQLSQDLELHALHVTRAAHGAIRDSYDIVEAPSSMQRPQADREVLEVHGRHARIYEVHGDLLFAGAESVVRAIAETADDLELLVLDVRRIGDVSEVAQRLLVSLRQSLLERSCDAVLVDPDGTLPVPPGEENGIQVFPTLLAATVWCEDKLLERHGDPLEQAQEELELAGHPLLQDVPQKLVDELELRMQEREFDDGELIVEQGDAEAGVFLIMAGRVQSSLTTGAGVTRRLAQLTPGTCFGDLYVVTGNPHLLTMHAVGDVRLLELTRDQYDVICGEDPELRAELLHLFMFAIQDDYDRVLRTLGNGRVTPMTAV